MESNYPDRDKFREEMKALLDEKLTEIAKEKGISVEDVMSIVRDIIEYIAERQL